MSSLYTFHPPPWIFCIGILWQDIHLDLASIGFDPVYREAEFGLHRCKFSDRQQPGGIVERKYLGECELIQLVSVV